MQLQHHYKNTDHAPDVEQYAARRLSSVCEKYCLEQPSAMLSHEVAPDHSYHIHLKLTDGRGHTFNFNQTSESAGVCVDKLSERVARVIRKSREKDFDKRRDKIGLVDRVTRTRNSQKKDYWKHLPEDPDFSEFQAEDLMVIPIIPEDKSI